MSEYIDLDLGPVDAEDLRQQGRDWMQSQAPPGWVINPWMDWLLGAVARMAVLVLVLAARVPLEIFKYFGQSVLKVQPVDATAATGSVTFHLSSNPAGRTIDAGAQVDIDGVSFETLAPLTITAPNLTGSVAVVAQETGADGSGLAGSVVDLVSPTLVWVDSVTLDAVTTGGTDAETGEEYADRLADELPTLSPKAILADDFAGLARADVEVFRALAIDNYNPQHNLLTANQASLETDTTGWAAQTNCAIARSTAQAADGAASLSLTSAAAGDMTTRTPTGTSGVPVTAGRTYTARAQFRAAASARSVAVGLEFFNASGTSLGAATYGTAVSDATGGFTTTAGVQAVAPAGATYAAVYVKVQATGAASEVHYVDKIGLRDGNDAFSLWYPGGSGAGVGVAGAITVAVQNDAGQPVSGAAKTRVATALADGRVLNLNVYAIDPTYTAMAVSFTGQCHAGYDPAAVLADAKQAITDLLNPAGWGVPSGGDANAWVDEPVVQRLDLIGALYRVPGMRHVTNLTLAKKGGTLATSDVTLDGPAALPTIADADIAGTVTT